MIAAADEIDPAVLHFTGHDRPGTLLFKNEMAVSHQVPVTEWIARLNANPNASLPRCPRTRLRREPGACNDPIDQYPLLQTHSAD